MRVQVVMYRQDDPKKCTAAKIVKFGLAQSIARTGKKTIVLDPFATRTILPADSALAGSVAAIDCSWNKADQAFADRLDGTHKRLPPLFAGNPVNYSKLSKLTTAEALAGALFILGYKNQAQEILAKFKWGHTFFELNENLLADYSKIQTESEIEPLLSEYNLL